MRNNLIKLMMRCDITTRVDGREQTFKVGEIYDLSPFVAEIFIENRWAIRVPTKAEPQNKKVVYPSHNKEGGS